MMLLDQYRAQHEGEQVDLDNYPIAQRFQCVDLASDYMNDVLGARRFIGNAKDIFGQQAEFLNWQKGGIPTRGSVFVYGSSWGGGYGHVGIVLSADAQLVTLLEQNVGAPRVTVGTHRRDGEIGWGAPKRDVIGSLQNSGAGRYEALRVANVRLAPLLNAALGGSRQLHPGEWFDAAAVVIGDTFKGNNRWVKSLRGNYIWAGNLKKIG